ncbi:TetR family transcriptional regulator C-terminal domain-containing protein [Marinibacterium sp. SX1]|uniref:TetR/AcrR family transcriptional regulator n=1 Tax=Marinibacterium sp. SX1 TaxID=3388424 RepID=UPI003D17D074
MARPRNDRANAESRTRLLEAGLASFRARSFAETGISDILQRASVPKGSFYHYFPTKTDFGLAVADHYHDGQIAAARAVLGDAGRPPLDRLRHFFEAARADMKARGYAEGCLMCNLTTELADAAPQFQAGLDRHWRALSVELARCLAEADLDRINLGHLTAQEAADWLLNAWSGALTRMKATRDDTPLALFLRSIFKD